MEHDQDDILPMFRTQSMRELINVFWLSSGPKLWVNLRLDG